MYARNGAELQGDSPFLEAPASEKSFTNESPANLMKSIILEAAVTTEPDE